MKQIEKKERKGFEKYKKGIQRERRKKHKYSVQLPAQSTKIHLSRNIFSFITPIACIWKKLKRKRLHYQLNQLLNWSLKLKLGIFESYIYFDVTMTSHLTFATPAASSSLLFIMMKSSTGLTSYTHTDWMIREKKNRDFVNTLWQVFHS